MKPFSVITLTFGFCAAFACATYQDAPPPLPIADAGEAVSDRSVSAPPDAPSKEEASVPPPIPKGTLRAGFQAKGAGQDDYDQFTTTEAQPVAFDALGNAYFAGSFSGTATFGDPTKNMCALEAIGGASDQDGYVAKIAADGSCIQAARLGGPSSRDSVRAIVISGNGQVNVVGQIISLAGDGSPFGWSINSKPQQSLLNGAFVAGLTADLATVVFAKGVLTQSLYYNEVRGIATNAVGDIAISGAVAIGYTNPVVTAVPFDNNVGVVASNGQGLKSGFVAEYKGDGTLKFARLWAARATGSSCGTVAGGVAYEANGDLLVLGSGTGYGACEYFTDSTKIVGAPDFEGSPSGGSRNTIVLVRYASGGGSSSVAYANPKEVASADPRSVSIAPNGDVYAAIRSSSHREFTFGSASVPASAPSSNSGILLRFRPSQTKFVEANFRVVSTATYSTQNEISAVRVDPFGNVVFGGTVGARALFAGAADGGTGKVLDFAGGTNDAYVAKFDPTLTDCLWLNRYGSTSTDEGIGLGMSNVGVIAVHGRFYGPFIKISDDRTLANTTPSGSSWEGFGAFVNP
jgi:hypothetical protein